MEQQQPQQPSSSSSSNFFRADLSHIPVEFVAPASSFGEDFQVGGWLAGASHQAAR